MKFLEFTLLPGKTLFIPAYWWYSIKFNKNTSISCFRYRTYMNNIAISPYIAMHALQIQNIKRKTAKKHDIKELNVEKPEIIHSDIERNQGLEESQGQHDVANNANTNISTIQTTSIDLLPL